MANDVLKTPTIERWQPDFRYRKDKMCDMELHVFKQSAPSVTDKEAYRVTLASLRGTLASGSGRPDVGSYSIPAGKEYDPRFDFSFLNRPDLNIVDLDEAIANMKKTLESYDGELSIEIKKQLAKAEAKAESMRIDEEVKQKSSASEE